MRSGVELRAPVLAFVLQPALDVLPQGAAKIVDRLSGIATRSLAQLGAEKLRGLVESPRILLVARAEILHVAARMNKTGQNGRRALADGGIVVVDVVAVRSDVGIEDLVIDPTMRQRSNMLGEVVQRRMPSAVLARNVE